MMQQIHDDTLDDIARDNDERDSIDKPMTDAEQAFSASLPTRCIPYDRV